MDAGETRQLVGEESLVGSSACWQRQSNGIRQRRDSRRQAISGGRNECQSPAAADMKWRSSACQRAAAPDDEAAAELPLAYHRLPAAKPGPPFTVPLPWPATFPPSNGIQRVTVRAEA